MNATRLLLLGTALLASACFQARELVYFDGDAAVPVGGDAGTCRTPCGQDCCKAGQACEGGKCVACTPSCVGKACGSDGCGGSCGTCATGACNANGRCEGCLPLCAGKDCGDDGCGGVCGVCAEGAVCNAGRCETCLPDCYGKRCGPDGCGGSCGKCSVGTCDLTGQCVACTPKCAGRQCGPDGCGGKCGACPPGQQCSDAGQCTCAPNCAGKSCGPDGCGGSCGTCSTGTCDASGQCAGCKPNCAGKACGPDGCGGSCGTCGAGKTCDALGQCVGCKPNCTGKACGSDGCGGECGTCSPNFHCVQGTCICTVDCGWRSCGPDGCGGTCGTCSAGMTCDPLGMCVGCTPNCYGKSCGSDGCGGTCGQCQPGSSCDVTTGRCSAVTCSPPCSTGQICDTSRVPPTCRLPAEKESCTPSTGCAAGLECTNISGFYICTRKCQSGRDCPNPYDACMPNNPNTPPELRNKCWFNICANPEIAANPAGERAKYFTLCNAAGTADGTCVPTMITGGAGVPTDIGFCVQGGTAPSHGRCTPDALRPNTAAMCPVRELCEEVQPNAGICRSLCDAAPAAATPVSCSPSDVCMDVSGATSPSVMTKARLGYCERSCALFGSDACPKDALGNNTGCSPMPSLDGKGFCRAQMPSAAGAGSICRESDDDPRNPCADRLVCSAQQILGIGLCVGVCDRNVCTSSTTPCAQCRPSGTRCEARATRVSFCGP